MSKIIPSNCTLILDPKAPRFSPENVLKIIDALTEKKLVVSHNGKVKETGHQLEWLEARLSGKNGTYTVIFAVWEKRITNVLAMVTPKGSVYNIDQDGGNISTLWSNKHPVLLNDMLMPPEVQCFIEPCWRIKIGTLTDNEVVTMKHDFGPNKERVNFPKSLSHNLFTDHAKAVAACNELEAYIKNSTMKREDLKGGLKRR